MLVLENTRNSTDHDSKFSLGGSCLSEYLLAQVTEWPIWTVVRRNPLQKRSIRMMIVALVERITRLDLNDNQRATFELLRSNQKDVDGITFDEVLERSEG